MFSKELLQMDVTDEKKKLAIVGVAIGLWYVWSYLSEEDDEHDEYSTNGKKIKQTNTTKNENEKEVRDYKEKKIEQTSPNDEEKMIVKAKEESIDDIKIEACIEMERKESEIIEYDLNFSENLESDENVVTGKDNEKPFELFGGEQKIFSDESKEEFIDDFHSELPEAEAQDLSEDLLQPQFFEDMKSNVEEEMGENNKKQKKEKSIYQTNTENSSEKARKKFKAMEFRDENLLEHRTSSTVYKFQEEERVEQIRAKNRAYESEIVKHDEEHQKIGLKNLKKMKKVQRTRKDLENSSHYPTPERIQRQVTATTEELLRKQVVKERLKMFEQ